MKYDDTPEEGACRAEVRKWIDSNAPKEFEAELSKPSLGRSRLQNEEIVDVGKAWQKKKAEAGWACLHWPKEYGGGRATPLAGGVWEQEGGGYRKPQEPVPEGEGVGGAAGGGPRALGDQSPHLPQT